MCDQPVLYIDNRWLYERSDQLGEITELRLEDQGPRVLRAGGDITLVGSGYATWLRRRNTR